MDFADIRPSLLNAIILLGMILLVVPGWKMLVATYGAYVPSGLKALTGMI